MLTLGKKVLLSRKDLDLTQVELAKLVGVSRSHIANVETGRVTNVGLDILTALAQALGVSPAYLMGLTEDPLADMDEEDEPPMLTDSKAVYRTDPVLSEITRLIEEMDEAKRLQMVGFARVLLHPPRIIGESE